MIPIIVNSTIFAMIYLLIGISFSIIYRTYKFFNIGHAVIVTCGAYLALYLLNRWDFAIGVFILAVLLSALIGGILEITILRYHRRKANSKLILMLTSIGVLIIIHNVLSMIFGDETQSIRSGVVQEGIQIYNATITPVQIWIIAVVIVSTVIVYMLLRYTKIGKAIKAVSNQEEVSKLSGIRPDQIYLYTMALGSGLAGLAGILIALDVDMTPTMGMNALMMGIVAMVIGGVNSIPGIALGALLLAFAQNIGVWYFGSAWQDAIAFGILLIFLIFRPQGFLGKRIKKATV